MTVQGLHHITLVSADAQRTVDFYTGLLGLRLVKQTVNFDDPGSLSPVLWRRDRAAPARRSPSSSGRTPRAASPASAARITSRFRSPTATACCAGSAG